MCYLYFKYGFPALLLSLLTGFTYCQNVKEQVQAGVVGINSISPADTNFTDLKPIIDAIGNARIVFLGEQDHGDAPCFKAKTRLVKYLHEQYDFDVLIFESDFYSINKNWQDGRNFEELEKSIYSVWTDCEQSQEMFQYLREQAKTSNPIIVSGCDSRHSRAFRSQYLLDFNRLMKSLNIPFFQSNYPVFEAILSDVIENEYSSTIAETQQEYFYQCLDTISRQLTAIDFENKPFWLQEMKSLKGHAANAWGDIEDQKGTDKNIRDIHMGENLVWLVQQKFPSEKIVVWAHNFHVSKNLSIINDSDRKNWTPYVSMGQIAFEKLGDEMYTIGFDSYQGETGRISETKKTKIKPPKGECVENWISETNYSYAFIDFKKLQVSESFKMKALGHYASTANWTQVFDGVFYIRDMYSCDKANKDR